MWHSGAISSRVRACVVFENLFRCRRTSGVCVCVFRRSLHQGVTFITQCRRVAIILIQNDRYTFDLRNTQRGCKLDCLSYLMSTTWQFSNSTTSYGTSRKSKQTAHHHGVTELIVDSKCPSSGERKTICSLSARHLMDTACLRSGEWARPFWATPYTIKPWETSA